MRAFQIATLTLLSTFSLASANDPAPAQIVAKIQNKSTTSEIVHSRRGNELSFHVMEGGQSTLLKTLTVKHTASEVSIAGDERRYPFAVVRALFEISGDAYSWCFTRIEQCDPYYHAGCVPATATGMFPLIPVSLPLCTTVPAVPALVGILLAPVDTAITAAKAAVNLTDSDEAAARKFAKMVRGKNSKASDAVFKSLIHQISNL